jgi:hypothetical protein|tara:strand:- start:10400 stop:10684 length:285 start_codon:yes stop_codon:yes gene_type:complete
MFGMGAEFARYFDATGFLNFGCNRRNDRSFCGMAFSRKMTQYFATANGACIESGTRDQVEEEKLDAKTHLSDIYRREAIGAFEDYRELIKGKNK